MNITLTKWDKFHPRKVIKNPNWFACSNRLIEDADFFSFSHGEFKAWIYIMSKASQKNSASIKLNFEHAEKVCGISKADMEGAIQKLQEMQSITIHDHAVIHACNTDVTRQDKTRQDKTIGITDSGESAEPAVEGLVPEDLFELWNTTANKLLPKAMKLTPSRIKTAKARIRENPDPQYWLDAIGKVNETRFLHGFNDRKWRADFDWFLQPDAIVKLFEGKYDR